jgi:hypothetical protein
MLVVTAVKADGYTSIRLAASEYVVGRSSLLPSCSADRRACVSNSKLPARTSIKVAVGYCTARCYQQFDYCIYRGEPLGVHHIRCPHARARDERRFQRAVTQTDLREPPGRCSGYWPHDGEVDGCAVEIGKSAALTVGDSVHHIR